MAAGGEDKGRDFYAVLGLKKECTAAELRYAYRKLAMRWHPDRCSALGNSNFVEEAKKKFQAIQEAYSVLSDANKRFLYDVGVYDNDDDENGMADFLNEMADMMCQAKSSENREESFEELQDLFEEMFQGEIDAFRCTSQSSSTATCSMSSSSPYQAYGESSNSSHKRNSSEMNSAKTKVEDSAAGFNNAHFQSFCMGTGGTESRFQERERNRRSCRRSHR